jgi:glutamyl-tRNA synthetase
MKYITRIAPSPTGPVHLGTVRTAYFNWLAARATNGKFIIRIDDTDLERSEQKWADKFLSSMIWLGLEWDELHYQSKRIDIHKSYADVLISKGLAKRDGNHVSLNLKDLPKTEFWVDSICGKIPIKSDNLAGFDQLTLIKTDGSPTYHFASCVDDIELGTNFIIRGVDHITNTSKHVLLYNLLEKEFPKIAHVGLIRTKEKKLSKRDPESDFQSYIDKGYDPDAILNFVGRLCWGPKIDDKSTSILTKDDMVRLFLDGGKMNSKDAMFDAIKLDSFDRKYKGRKNPRFTKGISNNV